MKGLESHVEKDGFRSLIALYLISFKQGGDSFISPTSKINIGLKSIKIILCYL